MVNTHILDSNRLINLKARHGIAITKGNSIGVYLSSKKLEKELYEKLNHLFKYKIDLDLFVESIVSKIDDANIYLTTIDYLKSITAEEFFKEAKRIKSFIVKMRNLTVS